MVHQFLRILINVNARDSGVVILMSTDGVRLYIHRFSPGRECLGIADFVFDAD